MSLRWLIGKTGLRAGRPGRAAGYPVPILKPGIDHEAYGVEGIGDPIQPSSDFRQTDAASQPSGRIDESVAQSTHGLVEIGCHGTTSKLDIQCLGMRADRQHVVRLQTPARYDDPRRIVALTDDLIDHSRYAHALENNVGRSSLERRLRFEGRDFARI